MTSRGVSLAKVILRPSLMSTGAFNGVDKSDPWSSRSITKGNNFKAMVILGKIFYQNQMGWAQNAAPKHLNLHGLSETSPVGNLQGRTRHWGHGATSTHSRTSGCLLECGSQQHDSLPWLRVAQIEELLCIALGFPW